MAKEEREKIGEPPGNPYGIDKDTGVVLSPGELEEERKKRAEEEGWREQK